MNNSKKLIFLVFLVRLTILLSIAGCVYQLWDITSEYFKKEVVTEIKIHNSNELTLPAISFCTRLPYLVNYTRLSSQHPDFVKLIRQKYVFVNSSESYSQLMETELGYEYVFKVLIRRFNLKELSELFYSWNELIHNVDIASNKEFGFLSDEEVRKQCDISIYSMELNACYRFDCSKSGPYVILNTDMKRNKYRDEVVNFWIRQNVFALIPHFNIYLHSPMTYPNGQNSPTIIIRSQEYGTLNYFSYKSYETDLLPPPYTSNCRDYGKDGFDSRQHAMAQCEDNLSLKFLNSPFYGNCHRMDSNFTHGYFYYFLQYKNKSIQSIVKQIESICMKKYKQPNCKEVFFVPKEKAPRPWKGQFTQIVLSWPSDPDVALVTKEKLPFSEFIILIESVFGTWFGFCFAGSLPIVYRWALRAQKDHFKEMNKSWKVKNLVKAKRRKSLELTVY